MRHTALAVRGAATSATTNGNSKALFDAWFKLDQISHSLDDEFQKVVLNQAEQIAAADPATFDVRTFVTSWTQHAEGYRSSTNAVSSFASELNKAINWTARQHSDELMQAAKEKRAALQAELDRLNAADTAIEAQIKMLDKFIGAADSPAAADGEQTTKRGRKRAGKQRRQRGAKKAAAKASKKGA